MENGIHRNVAFAEYLRWPILSQSVLKRGRESMAHLKAAFDRVATATVTDDMLLGSALHVAFLEPELMPERVVVWKGERRYGAEWDGFQDEHADKIILTRGYYDHLVGMTRSLRQQPFVRAWSERIEDVEVSAIGDLCGTRFKARCDALTTDPLIDLKKVASADPALITKTVLNFGYHIQAWAYRELFNRQRFTLICVEGQPPYDVVPYELAPAFLRLGEQQGKDLLDEYERCLAADHWPGRSDQVVTLEPPEWAMPEVGLSLGGVAVEL